jgi:hypothetical protein
MSARIGRTVGVVLVLVGAVALLITATSGASVVSMDRSISVQVSEDGGPVALEVVSGGADDADEVFWKNESTVVASNERALVTVSNRLDRPIEVTEAETPAAATLETGTAVGPGETTTITGTLDCNRLGEESTATLTLVADGLETTQPIDIDPACSSERD